MKITSIQEELFLLGLYDVKQGTMSEIIREVGIYSVHCGKGYQIKKDLLDEGILEHDGFSTDSKDRTRPVFKVNHSNLDKFFAFKTHTKILFKRFDNIVLRIRGD